MTFFRRLPIGLRLPLIGIIAGLIPLGCLAMAMLWQNSRIRESAGPAFEQLALANLQSTADGIYSMCAAQQELLERGVVTDLKVARHLLETSGGLRATRAMVRWEAMSPNAENSTEVMLPRLEIGDTAMLPSTSFHDSAPLVDGMTALTAAKCTIFQRMNEAGDMLVVATSAQKPNGDRAVGDVISSRNPDGTTSEVIASLMSGRSWVGRGEIADECCITAYEPIYSDSGEIIGALQVGISAGALSIRRAIVDTQVGGSGYAYVLGAEAENRGRYIISEDGARDGESVWDSRDADGMYIIRSMCQAAESLGPDDYEIFRYAKGENDSGPSYKVALVKYFEPWDWVIAVESFEDEFYGARNRTEEIMTGTQKAAFGIALLALSLSFFLTWSMARSISSPIRRIVEGLNEGADQVASASEQVAASSQKLADDSSTQAASLQQISSSLQQMTAMTRQNAENSGQAKGLAKETLDAAERGNEGMSRMSEAIGKIKASSDETSKILKTIDDIAFQTNLLALNAAVEAARAGEAGKGFAVVAQEVRELARRSAQAAKDTAAMIDESIRNAEEGVRISEVVARSLGEIAERANKVNDLVAEISAASREQASGIEEISAGASRMDRITQSTAAGAEESASASEELSAQASAIRSMIEELALVIGNPRGSGHHLRHGSIGGRTKTRSDSFGGVHGLASDLQSRFASREREKRPEDYIPLDEEEDEEILASF